MEPELTYRNRALLDLAHEAPCFLQLGQPDCGANPSVPCHSDMIRHGRGQHHKSHDCFAVPGCPACHEVFKRSALGRAGYLETWTAAMERFTLWLWVSDRVRIINKQAPKEPSMEAPMCRLCLKRHWAREGCNFGKVEVNAEHTKKVLNQAAESLGLKNAKQKEANPATGKAAKPAVAPAKPPRKKAKKKGKKK